MKTALLIVFWTALLAAAGGVAVYLWVELGDVSLGVHGWVALTLGVVLSLVLGVGLMVLVFVSSRRGYDEGARGNDPGASERDPPNAQP